MSRLKIRPVTKTEARRFVQEHHRHNEAPSSMQVQLVVGLYDEDTLVGVATAGHPIARAFNGQNMLEINRTCIDGYHKNGNSLLYGAICRAAKALGYEKVTTYTLHDESGVSLKASGFKIVDDVGLTSWQDGTKSRVRYDFNLFGERRQAIGQAKYRWERDL